MIAPLFITSGSLVNNPIKELANTPNIKAKLNPIIEVIIIPFLIISLTLGILLHP